MTEYEMNPDVCSSSLGEDGTPMTEGETAHKWYGGGKCEECGATREKAFKCPLCATGEVFHEVQDSTDIYICEQCPFIALEFYQDRNAQDLINYLKRDV